MKKFLDYLAFWRNWDDAERVTARKITGLAVAVLCLFVLIACTSYLFHWKEDMSLLGDPSMMDSGASVGNIAGKLGYKTGHLLVCRLFGLGSFALLVILAAVSIRLISGKKWFSLFKTTIIALTGALLASVTFAFIGDKVGLADAFYGGLGGECGSRIVAWSENLFKSIITGALIVLLLCCWLFLCSKKFSKWVYGLGNREKKEPATVTDYGLGSGPESGYEPEPEPEPEPESEPEPEPAPAVHAPAGPGPAAEGSLEVITDQQGTLDEQDHYEDLPPIDNRMDPPEGLPKYRFPSLDLLHAHASERRQVSITTRYALPCAISR